MDISELDSSDDHARENEADDGMYVDDTSEVGSYNKDDNTHYDLNESTDWWFYWSNERKLWCFAQGHPAGDQPMHQYHYRPLALISQPRREHILAYHQSVVHAANREI